MNIKLISFDLWDTLFKGSQDFAQARLEYLMRLQTQRPVARSREEVIMALRLLKQEFTLMTEMLGVQFDAYTVYKALFDFLDADIEDIGSAMGDINRLFLKHLPTLYPDVEQTLSTIKDMYPDIPLVLISNTLFVGGETLHAAMGILGISKYFDYVFFSDDYDVNCSKPDQKIFIRAYRDFFVAPSEILHVGDLPTTDGIGITQVGGTFFQVHKNNRELFDLISYLKT